MLIGYALCGSYCTFERSLDELRRMVDEMFEKNKETIPWTEK